MSASHRAPAAARAVADAVLYEGYLLYPYRASSEKNQVALAVRRARAARCGRRGLGEPATSTCTVPAATSAPAAAVDVHLRFLQLQHRQVERRRGRR